MPHDYRLDPRGPKVPRDDSRRVTREALAHRALNMRLAGASYTEIGNALGIREDYVRSLVSKRLSKLKKETRENGEEIIQLELSRLDAMYAAAMFHLRSGDLSAIDKIIKIMDRRSKYLGLDGGAFLQDQGSKKQLDLKNLDMGELDVMEQMLLKAANGPVEGDDEAERELTDEDLANIDLDAISDPVIEALVGNAQDTQKQAPGGHKGQLVVLRRDEPTPEVTRVSSLADDALDAEVIVETYSDGESRYASFGGD